MKFIVFEGLDGSGKSSLMKKLESYLKDQAVDFISTREPGGSPLGDKIRNLILTQNEDVGLNPTARTELLLYEASRSQHVDTVIQPALQAKKWVLCDRFSASSVAFQAGGRQISIEQVIQLNQFATSHLEPDLYVLLDLTVEESKRRRQQRQGALGESEDRIESESQLFHQRVRKGFLDQALETPTQWLVLEASKSPEQLFDLLLTELRNRQWLV